MPPADTNVSPTPSPVRILLLVLLLVGSAAVPSRGATEPTGGLDPADIRNSATELAELLEENYVFPEVGARYSAHLRERVAGGAYDAMTDPAELAAAFEAELNGVHEDAHLRVTAIGDQREAPRRRRPLGMPAGQALSGARWIADDVAYVAVNLLPGDEASQQAMADFLAEYEGARALILDLRACPGGTLPVMDVLFSRLYGQRTHLVTMDTRAEAERSSGAVFSESATLTREPAPDGLVRRFHWADPQDPEGPWTATPVYVLTGGTGSACEHLALALKASGRATLVGTATGGAGHYGGVESFGGGRFEVFLPVGRTFDPHTGLDWEGTGVTPHLEVSAEGALDRALAELGVEREAPPPLEGAEDYVGLYGNRRITLDGGELHLQRIDVADSRQPGSGTRRVAPKLVLRPLGNEEFELPRVPGALVRFERNSEGQIVGLAVRQRDGSWDEARRSPDSQDVMR